MTKWISLRRFQEICIDGLDMLEYEFKQLQDLCESLGMNLTKDNWQSVYKLYKAKYNMRKAEKEYERDVGILSK